MPSKSITFNFQKMTPTKVNEMHGYNESLDFVLNDEEILNVAITGAYGAGKTSVIRTYEKNNKKNFMYISLAEFENNQEGEKENGDDVSNRNSDKSESEETKGSAKLEGKIINQIINQIKPKYIPQTEFRTRNDTSDGKINVMFILSALLFVSAVYILSFNYWGDIVFKLNEGTLSKILHFTTLYPSLIIAIFVNIIILLVFLYKIIGNLLNGIVLKKIKFFNNEIELFDKKNDSYFDKHLEEILYIFRKSNYKVIVFEDIDRFNNNNIFIRLREINTIINANMKNEHSVKSSNTYQPIRFIYLLKDEIFESNDRTKFFDFILPIVPVTDASNSFNKLKEIMEAGEIYDDFDHVFLERVCIYIDDMRVLKNIFNEYLIYRTRLMKPKQKVSDNNKIEPTQQGLELDPNRLFAMIVYKNIFSEDFSQLQLRKGFVYNVVENKSKLIEEKLEEIDDCLNEIEEEIKTIQQETLKGIDELDALYFNYGYSIKVEGKLANEFNNRIDFIRAIKDNNYDIQISSGRNYGFTNENIEHAFKELDENSEYFKRKKLIDSRKAGKLKKLLEESGKLKEERKRINGSRLEELLHTNNIDVYLGNKSSGIKDAKYYNLTRFLIRNGYINENYQDYLTYFIPNNLSHEDKEFLIGVSDEISKEFSYKLDNPNLIVAKLKQHDFLKEIVLNYSLLSYLIETENAYLKDIIKHVKVNRRFDFVFGYIDDVGGSDQFIQKLNEIWPEIIYDMNSSKIGWDKIKPYLLHTLYLSTFEQLEEMNMEHILTDLISTDELFLEIDDPGIDKLIDAFAVLEIKFITIDYEKSNIDLFDSVYKHNFYELNKNNLRQMMKVQLAVSDDNFKYQNYSFLLSHRKEPIFNYIESNINNYIEIVVDAEEIRDEEKAALEIINHSTIEKNNKIAYINRLSTKISKIVKIEDSSIITVLFSQIKVSNSIENIIDYYDKVDEIDSTLINYINEVEDNFIIGSKNFEDLYDMNFLFNFVNKLIESNDLDIYKLQELVVHIGIKNEKISFGNITTENLNILIENKLIELNEVTLEQIRDKYTSSLILFIEHNIDDYMLLLENEIPAEDELLEIIKDAQIGDSEKIELLQHITQSISVVDEYSPGYTDKIKIYIIENNYDENDFAELVSNFSNYSSEMQEAIFGVFVTKLDGLFESHINIDKELLGRLFKSEDIDFEFKKDLYFNSYQGLSLEETKQYLDYCKLDDFNRLLDGKRPRFTINKENKNVLDYFMENDWIASYKENVDGDMEYFTFGKTRQAIQV